MRGWILPSLRHWALRAKGDSRLVICQVGLVTGNIRATNNVGLVISKGSGELVAGKIMKDMEETGGATAYGASLAGGSFNFQKFARQPQTIVRVLSWVSSIIPPWVSWLLKGKD